MSHNNRHKATVTLAIVTVGYLASYPFAHTFTGGLLASMFGASMVGGLADWFAVSALFRRPLGIPFRTAVIPRNRQRIFASIVDMVQNQLLTPVNIGRTLDRFQMADLLFRYWEEHGGRQDLRDILARIGRDITAGADADSIGRMVEQLIRQSAARVDIAPVVAEALEWSVRSGHDEKLVRFLLAEIRALVEREGFRTLLASFFAEAREAYEQDMLRRRVANQLLEHFLKLSPERLAGLAQNKLTAFLEEGHTSSLLHYRFREWVHSMTERLQSDVAFRQRIEDWKMAVLGKHLDLRGHIAALVVDLQARWQGEPELERSWLTLLTQETDQLLIGLASDPERRGKINEVARIAFLEAVAAHHEEIGQIVRDRLDQFSDVMLVDFMESRIGEDLQMIRINGSVVGGLVGMVLFFLTFWLL